MANHDSDPIKQIEITKEVNETNLDKIPQKVDQNTARLNNLYKKNDRTTQPQTASETSGNVPINLLYFVCLSVQLSPWLIKATTAL